MAYTDFNLAQPTDAARQRAGEALASVGYKVNVNPNGSLYGVRGSKKKTLLIGALAGNDFYTELTVELFPQGPGHTIARIVKDTAGNALKGGVIGANKAQGFYDEAVGALRQSFGSSIQSENRV